MNVIRTELEGILIVEPPVFQDARGFFMEAWHHEKYAAAGITERFVQDNISMSRQGVLRGLHFQNPGEQGKLVSVLTGKVFDVAVDLRTDSPTFKRWVGVELSRENRRQLYIPPGYAHGFTVLSDEALFVYKCTQYYRQDYEHALRWDDPEIGIDWPGADHIMSEKDLAAPLLRDLPKSALPTIKK